MGVICGHGREARKYNKFLWHSAVQSLVVESQEKGVKGVTNFLAR